MILRWSFLFQNWLLECFGVRLFTRSFRSLPLVSIESIKLWNNILYTSWTNFFIYRIFRNSGELAWSMFSYCSIPCLSYHLFTLWQSSGLLGYIRMWSCDFFFILRNLRWWGEWYSRDYRNRLYWDFGKFRFIDVYLVEVRLWCLA